MGLTLPSQNRIKQQAKEHERFRKYCVGVAQWIHRADMRMRLGLLQDKATIDKQIAREAAEAQAKKHKHSHPTVKTEAQSKLDEIAVSREKDKARDAAKEEAKNAKVTKRKIKPLSEAAAIETGANFVAETFVFSVALGVLFLQDQWSRSKKSSQDEKEAEALAALKADNQTYRTSVLELEKEVLRLRAKDPDFKGPNKRLLPRELWDQQDEGIISPEPKKSGWFSGLLSWSSQESERDERQKPIDNPKLKSDMNPKESSAPPSSREQTQNKTQKIVEATSNVSR